MIRSAIRWMRVVLPPAWALGAFAFLYLLVTMIRWGVFFGLSEGDIVMVAKELAYPHKMVMGMAAVGYALWRVFSFHPVCLPAYQKWLKQTPWTSVSPLPAGPVHLVPQDGIVLGTLLLLASSSPGAVWITFAAFSVAYLLALGVTFWATGPRWAAYVVLFGLAMLVRVHPMHIATVAAAITLYGLAYRGLRQALQQFPWEIPAAWQAFFPFAKSEGRPSQQNLGWPIDLLNPTSVAPAVGYRDGVLLSLAGGWWTYVSLTLAPTAQERLEAATLLTVLVLSACVVSRLLVYCWLYWSPISLLGRLWTRRWVIPGYDQVFVAPLCTLTVGLGFIWGLGTIGLGREHLAPLAVTTVILTALNMGPSLQRWRLTGTHRLSPLLGSSTEFVKL